VRCGENLQPLKKLGCAPFNDFYVFNLIIIENLLETFSGEIRIADEDALKDFESIINTKLIEHFIITKKSHELFAGDGGGM
jgi:hypothetical protein